MFTLTTCLVKDPKKRVVILDYKSAEDRGILCLDLDGDKLWEMCPSHDPCVMQYPCGDDKGNVFLVDDTLKTIFVRKDQLSMELLLKIPVGIKKYRWSDTMNKLVVLHLNETRDSIIASCYDIVEL